MKITIDKYEFSNLFDAYNRSENFSREARELIFDYLEAIDPDAEVDIIAICCDITEASIYEIEDMYRLCIDRSQLTEEEYHAEVLEYLNLVTNVIGSTYNDTHIVYEQF